MLSLAIEMSVILDSMQSCKTDDARATSRLTPIAATAAAVRRPHCQMPREIC